ncbi:MAG: hypothetical protein IT292_00095 [Deltaproteobacteria bacterium]|nr:hypothetical protein [Deltaproteobacteria bacterium]
MIEFMQSSLMQKSLYLLILLYSIFALAFLTEAQNPSSNKATNKLNAGTTRKTNTSRLESKAVKAKGVNPSASSKHSYSFIDYVPNRVDYTPVLQPFIPRINKAISNIKATKSASVSQKCEVIKPIIEELQNVIASINRAYIYEAYFLIGFSYESCDNKQAAIEMYEKSLAQKINNPIAQFRHAAILADSNRCPEAITELKELTWRETINTEEILYKIAQCLFILEQNEAAFKTLNTALNSNPLFISAHRLYIENTRLLLEKTSDPDKQNGYKRDILAHLTKINHIDPNDHDAGMILAEELLTGADLLIEPKRLSRAETIAKYFVDNSEYNDEQAVGILISIRLKQQRYSEAAELAKKGLSKNPQSKLLSNKIKQIELESKLSKSTTNQDSEDISQ